MQTFIDLSKDMNKENNLYSMHSTSLIIGNCSISQLLPPIPNSDWLSNVIASWLMLLKNSKIRDNVNFLAHTLGLINTRVFNNHKHTDTSLGAIVNKDLVE